MRKLLMSIIFNRFFPKWITFKYIRKWNSSKSGQEPKYIVTINKGAFKELNWFSSLSDLFKTERVRTVIKINGNKLNYVWLDYKGKAIKTGEVKFKSSSKLKKFWEVYMLRGDIKYHGVERLFWSEQLIKIEKFE